MGYQHRRERQLGQQIRLVLFLLLRALGLLLGLFLFSLSTFFWRLVSPSPVPKRTSREHLPDIENE